jgi:transposase InsO family protein
MPAWVRRTVIGLLEISGGDLGVPTLQSYFPEATRAALEDLKSRYRRVQRRRSLVHVLYWRRAGAVWAADFSDPPAPIEGCYSDLMNVRDLPSYKQLASLPVYDETVETTLLVLESLVRWHGAPLVLKVDNGSAFIAHKTRAWAAAKGIFLLYSPPRTPEYNGAIEAGTGSMKTRAFHHAARHDRPWEWTCDDVEAARLQANETSRPFGPHGPTPDEKWQTRERIRDDERVVFAEEYQHQLERERQDRGIPEGVQVQAQERDQIERAALVRALVQLGFFSIRRRRIPPRKSRR